MQPFNRPAQSCIAMSNGPSRRRSRRGRHPQTGLKESHGTAKFAWHDLVHDGCELSASTACLATRSGGWSDLGYEIHVLKSTWLTDSGCLSRGDVCPELCNEDVLRPRLERTIPSGGDELPHWSSTCSGQGLKQSRLQAWTSETPDSFPFQLSAALKVAAGAARRCLGCLNSSPGGGRSLTQPDSLCAINMVKPAKLECGQISSR